MALQNERRFYVYVHRRKSDGQIFYVGKGTRDRAWARDGRNSHWRNVVSKHGFTHHIISRFSSEVCAFSLERALIGFYGRKNLVNKTDGGEGVSGHKPTGCHRINMIVARLGLKRSPEHIAKVAAFHTGRKRSPETGIKISQNALSRLKNPRNHWHTTEVVSTWWHEDGEIRRATHIEMAQEFSLSIEALKRIEIGKGFAHKGWKVAGVRNYTMQYLSVCKKTNNTIYVWHKKGSNSFVGTRNDFVMANCGTRREAEYAPRASTSKYGRGKWTCREL
jgi:hypothetical protein